MFFISNLLLMVLISALVKKMAEDYPVTQLLVFRYLFAVIPLLGFAIWKLGMQSLKTTRYLDHGIRSVSGILGISLFFFAIALIPIAEATMLSYISPIFVVILSIPLLSEKVGLKRWLAVLIGFVGVIIVAQPGSAIFNVGGLVAIASAFFAAFVVIWLRKLSDTEHPTTIAIYYNGLGAMVFIGWAIFTGWTEVQSTLHWILLICIGLVASFQQFFLAISFRYGEASLLVPFEYLILIFTAMVGYVYWGEVPGITSITGAIFIVISGLIILYRTNEKSESTINRLK